MLLTKNNRGESVLLVRGKKRLMLSPTLNARPRKLLSRTVNARPDRLLSRTINVNVRSSKLLLRMLNVRLSKLLPRTLSALPSKLLPRTLTRMLSVRPSKLLRRTLTRMLIVRPSKLLPRTFTRMLIVRRIKLLRLMPKPMPRVLNIRNYLKLIRRRYPVDLHIELEKCIHNWPNDLLQDVALNSETHYNNTTPTYSLHMTQMCIRTLAMEL